jgi:hypothetical protein
MASLWHGVAAAKKMAKASKRRQQMAAILWRIVAWRSAMRLRIFRRFAASNVALAGVMAMASAAAKKSGKRRESDNGIAGVMAAENRQWRNIGVIMASAAGIAAKAMAACSINIMASKYRVAQRQRQLSAKRTT